MNELRVLDMSEDRDNHPFEMFVSIGSKTNEFLNKEKVLENLTTLDISGKHFIYFKNKKLQAIMCYCAKYYIHCC